MKAIHFHAGGFFFLFDKGCVQLSVWPQSLKILTECRTVGWYTWLWSTSLYTVYIWWGYNNYSASLKSFGSLLFCLAELLHISQLNFNKAVSLHFFTSYSTGMGPKHYHLIPTATATVNSHKPPLIHNICLALGENVWFCSKFDGLGLFDVHIRITHSWQMTVIYDNATFMGAWGQWNGAICNVILKLCYHSYQQIYAQMMYNAAHVQLKTHIWKMACFDEGQLGVNRHSCGRKGNRGPSDTSEQLGPLPLWALAGSLFSLSFVDLLSPAFISRFCTGRCQTFPTSQVLTYKRQRLLHNVVIEWA